MADFREFASTMDRLFAEGQRNIQRHLVNTTVKMVLDLAEHTPVDTSRALSNWQVSANRNATYLLPAFEGHRGSTQLQSIGATAHHARDNARRLLDIRTIVNRGRARVFIVNTAPYIQDLNEGASPQQSAGWIEQVSEESFRQSQRGAPMFIGRGS